MHFFTIAPVLFAAFSAAQVSIHSMVPRPVANPESRTPSTTNLILKATAYPSPRVRVAGPSFHLCRPFRQNRINSKSNGRLAGTTSNHCKSRMVLNARSFSKNSCTKNLPWPNTNIRAGTPVAKTCWMLLRKAIRRLTRGAKSVLSAASTR